MQAVVVQWRLCGSRFRSGRVGPCCQKQQMANHNQPVAAAALRWPVGNSVRAARLKAAAMALLCCANGSITLLWQRRYTAMAWELLCCGNGVALP